MLRHANLIGGQWVPGIPVPNINPSDTSDVVGDSQLLAGEEGKTVREALREVKRAARIFEFFSGEALRLRGETLRSTRLGVHAVGIVMVNLPTAGVDYHVPYGGRKQSSFGPREQGAYAAEFYTTVKTAYANAG